MYHSLGVEEQHDIRHSKLSRDVVRGRLEYEQQSCGISLISRVYPQSMDQRGIILACAQQPDIVQCGRVY